MTTKAMDWLTAVVALGAILLLGSALIERLSGRTHPFSSGRPVAVDNWGELTSGGHRLGPADARVTIVEFGDYECPACRSAYPEIERALEKYGQDVTLVYRHWPLEYHSLALPAAVAAECAAEQGVFWEYHDRLYSSRGWLASAMGVTFSDLAEDVGVADL